MNKIYVVGMGPGAYEQMTVKAVRAIEMSQVIVGYTVYTDLLKKEFPDKGISEYAYAAGSRALPHGL